MRSIHRPLRLAFLVLVPLGMRVSEGAERATEYLTDVGKAQQLVERAQALRDAVAQYAAAGTALREQKALYETIGPRLLAAHQAITLIPGQTSQLSNAVADARRDLETWASTCEQQVRAEKPDFQAVVDEATTVDAVLSQIDTFSRQACPAQFVLRRCEYVLERAAVIRSLLDQVSSIRKLSWRDPRTHYVVDDGALDLINQVLSRTHALRVEVEALEQVVASWARTVKNTRAQVAAGWAAALRAAGSLRARHVAERLQQDYTQLLNEILVAPTIGQELSRPWGLILDLQYRHFSPRLALRKLRQQWSAIRVAEGRVTNTALGPVIRAWLEARVQGAWQTYQRDLQRLTTLDSAAIAQMDQTRGQRAAAMLAGLRAAGVALAESCARLAAESAEPSVAGEERFERFRQQCVDEGGAP